MAVCLLGGVSSVWASTVSDLTSITAPVTITMDGINGTSPLADGTLYYSNKLLGERPCFHVEIAPSGTTRTMSMKAINLHLGYER